MQKSMVPNRVSRLSFNGHRVVRIHPPLQGFSLKPARLMPAKEHLSDHLVKTRLYHTNIPSGTPFSKQQNGGLRETISDLIPTSGMANLAAMR